MTRYCFTHELFKKRCMSHAIWKNGNLTCLKCDELIALRYMIGDELIVHVFPKYRRFTKQINARKDTYENLKKGGIVGHLSLSEIEDFLPNLEPGQDDVLPILDDEWGECQDDIEIKGLCAVT